MHIPDGYLGPVTYGGLWAAMAPVWAHASRRVKAEVRTAQVPHLAMAAAYSLIVMIFTIPLPGGTTAHMTGAALVAILLDPWAAVLAVSVALIIQALIFGDGGITALGANCFNIAFVGSLGGYWTYRLASGLAARVKGGQARGAGRTPTALHLTAGAIAAYASVNLGGLCTAVQLGIQSTIHPGSPNPQYFPYPMSVTLPAVMVPHLTAVGALEGVVTSLVLGFIRRVQPDMGRAWKSALGIVLLVSMWPISSTQAHEFWIEARGGQYAVVFGHGDSREEFDTSRIKKVRALDASGGEMTVNSQKADRAVILRPQGAPCVIAVEIDGGYWSKTIYGWKNVGKSKASRVIEANRTLNFSKAILSWDEPALMPAGEAAMDLVPLGKPAPGGGSLGVRVLSQGRPLAGAEVLGKDHQRIGSTDGEGVIQIPLSKGRHVLTVTHKEPLKGDPDADFLSLTATLTFEVGP
jgi:cobalt/nickel transport system permease protein